MWVTKDEKMAAHTDPPVSVEELDIAEASAFQRDLLFNLMRVENEEPNGVDVEQQLREFYGEEINHSRLYQNLRELVSIGFVKKQQTDGRENIYKTTEPARTIMSEYADFLNRSFRV
jgi:predicted transcriptional regulator